MKLAGFVARLGHGMREHRGAIQIVQWGVVAFYLLLVAVPAFLPLPPAEARMFDHLTVFAQFLFWGIWWPFVIVSMLLVGRVWCGVFCPEGALSEWASERGLGRPVPRWIKWEGWPLVAFVLTTVYGQLTSVYQYPKPVLLVLGGSTVAAIAIGLVYGRGKRVWCRYLCPVNGVFALLAKVSPLHFAVDRARWDAGSGRKVIPINCAPLVDVRRMEGASACHQCGRCSGQRDAVQLSLRPMNREIGSLRVEQTSRWEIALLLFGLIGVAVGAFQWSGSPWFVAGKQWLAQWLLENERALWLLDDTAPWWLLTHYPQLNDSFSWLDGGMVVAYIAVIALLLGGWQLLWLALAGRVQGRDWRANLARLAYCQVPVAGLGVFLGLSATTVSLLRAEGLNVSWAPTVRALLLVIALLWSGRLAWLQLRALPDGRRRVLAWLSYLPAPLGVLYSWLLLFFLW